MAKLLGPLSCSACAGRRASTNLQTFIFSVTDQLSITWSRRSVKIFKLSVLTFSRSMSCSMSFEQILCKVKVFQLQSMSNAIRCIDQRFAFKNSRISCLALMFKFKILAWQSCHSTQKNWLQVVKYDESCTVCFLLLIKTNGWVVKASSRESGDMG